MPHSGPGNSSSAPLFGLASVATGVRSSSRWAPWQATWPAELPSRAPYSPPSPVKVFQIGYRRMCLQNAMPDLTLACGNPSWKYVGSQDSSTKKQLFWHAWASTQAQNDGFPNNRNHGTESCVVRLLTHNRFGSDRLMTRKRSDDIV